MTDRLTARAFTWDDVARVHELIARRWSVDGARARMHIGDFYWALRPTPNGNPLREFRLWAGGDGSLDAYAWYDGPSSGEVVLAPGADRRAFDEALDWLEEAHRSGSDAPFSLLALDRDALRVGALSRRGYQRGEAAAVRFWQMLDAAREAAPVPEGYSMRHVSSDADMQRRAFVQTTSFEHSTATVDVWRALMELPAYRPELDLILVAPDGTGASACTCWYDEANLCGEFEPVGTSKAYQSMGLGKAVIAEGLRRLQTLGATQAIVQTNATNLPAIALYRSSGFEVVGKDHPWTRAL